MPDDLVINEQLSIPASELRVSFARSGGPGGQNVNKVESKVELRWTPGASEVLPQADAVWLSRRLQAKLTADGDLVVTSSRTRDQAQNREDARQKLAALIRAALVRPKRRKPTRPSRRAVERRLQQKRQLSQAKKKRGPTDYNTHD